MTPTDPARQLSQHFRLEELLVHGGGPEVQNAPTLEAVQDLELGAVYVLEPLRAALGVPLVVTSGFRSDEVHADLARRGYAPSPTSDHRRGRAADLVSPRATQARIWAALVDLLEAGQLPHLDQGIVYEDRGHVHVGWRPEGARGQLLVHLAQPTPEGKRYMAWADYRGPLKQPPAISYNPGPLQAQPAAALEAAAGPHLGNTTMDDTPKTSPISPEALALKVLGRARAKGTGRKLQLSEVWDLVHRAVGLAEQVIGAGDGPAKRRMAVAILNEAVDLPVLGEGAEAVIIGFLVDLVVGLIRPTKFS